MHVPFPTETVHRSPGVQELQWLLENLVTQTPGARRAVVVSRDGLLLLSTDPTHRDPTAAPWGAGGVRHGAEAASVISGINSLTHGASHLMNGGAVRRTAITLAHGGLLLSPLGEGALLGAHTGPECDPTAAAQQVARYAEQVARLLTPEVRRELRAAVPPVD